MTAWSVAVDSGVAVISLTPQPTGGVSFAAMTELAELLTDLAQRVDVRVVVLAGVAHDVFVGDVDRDELARMVANEPVDGDPSSWSRALSMLRTIRPPTVAAVDGVAGPAGCAMMLSCTLRLGSERAQLGPFPVGGLGVAGTEIAPHLVRLVGSGLATELLLAGSVVHADNAHRIGLLNDVLPSASFTDHVRAWCAPIVAADPAGIFLAKQAVAGAVAVTYDEASIVASMTAHGVTPPTRLTL